VGNLAWFSDSLRFDHVAGEMPAPLSAARAETHAGFRDSGGPSSAQTGWNQLLLCLLHWGAASPKKFRANALKSRHGLTA